MALVVGSGADEESSRLALTLAALTETDFSRLSVCYEAPALPGEPRVSAISLIEIATETGQQHAVRTWQNIRDFLNTSGVTSYLVPGHGGSRSSEMVDIRTALRIILLLPGKAAAKWRVRASVLLIRFLGGDLSLVGEVYGLNELQGYLREHHPEHPLAAFISSSPQEAELELERQAKRARLLREIAADNAEAARLNERIARARDVVSVEIAEHVIAVYNQVQAMESLDARERTALRDRIMPSFLGVEQVERPRT